EIGVEVAEIETILHPWAEYVDNGVYDSWEEDEDIDMAYDAWSDGNDDIDRAINLWVDADYADTAFNSLADDDLIDTAFNALVKQYHKAAKKMDKVIKPLMRF